jgi:Rdx family protein
LRENGFEASARAGEKSQFDVVADGRLVFSKQSVGRWPEDGEVLSLVDSGPRGS